MSKQPKSDESSRFCERLDDTSPALSLQAYKHNWVVKLPQLHHEQAAGMLD